MSPTNPVTLKVLEEMGAGTVNIPADMTLDELAEMRAAVKLPLDLYVESPMRWPGWCAARSSAT
jgi:hypothetical protein